MSISVQRETKPFDQWLDMFRWLAAFVVLFTHTTNRFLLPLSTVSGPKSLFYYVIGFMTGFSHQAVMVFFVLSGFLVGGGLFREYQKNGTINAPVYLAKRFARLWTVVVPAMLLSHVANLTAAALFPASFASVYPSSIWQQSDLPTFACNLAFLQTAACYAFGGNGPLWSIFNEFWYYIAWLGLFPFLFIRASNPWNAAFAALSIALLFLLTAWQFSGSSIGAYMIVWLLGVVIAILPSPLIRSPGLAALMLGIFLIALRLGVRRDFGEMHPVGTFALDAALGGLFALLVSALQSRANLAPPPGKSIHSSLADFSFSLYCIHAPLLNLYGLAMYDRFGFRPPAAPASARDWLIILAPVFFMPFAAYLFSLAAEKQTWRVRKLLQQLFTQSQSSDRKTK